MLLGTALLIACSSAAGAGASTTPSQAVAARTKALCERTTARDPAGVVTANGTFGVVGDTFSPASLAMNEPLLIVHRGAAINDTVSLVFRDIGHTTPAKWVSYAVGASTRPNPWGEVAFAAGWKPIGFAGSCWRVEVDGADSGLVLEVGS